MSVVHKAAGAGRWFPASPAKLRSDVERYISSAAVDVAEVTSRPIIGVIAPHAGTRNPTPLERFRALKEHAKAHGEPAVVVVLGFSHRSSFSGIVVMDGDELQTPVGTSRLDRACAEAMCAGRSPRVRVGWGPHAGEHSAENEVPFVQCALPGARLVVALVADHSEQTLSDAADALADVRRAEPSAVVVASSDMLHDADWQYVGRGDRETLALVERVDAAGVAARWSYAAQCFCGIAPVLALMRHAQRCGATRGLVLHYRNSGDDFPDSRGDWVVGYGAVAFQ
eukprot:m51a1_g3909 hypothetical protein (283) ;mRNA; f:133287-134458